MKRISQKFLRLLVLTTLSPAVMAAVDGSFDTSFNGVGYKAFDGDQHNASVDSYASRIIVEANGNLLLGGGVGNYWWLGELLSTGTPVLTFGESNGSGLVTSCYLSSDLCADGSGDFFNAFTLQADGRISVANVTTLARTMSHANSLDTSSGGGNGYVSTQIQINNVQGRLALVHALTQTSAGKWLVAGPGYYTGTSKYYDFAVMRLNADFSLDTTFNATTDSNGVAFAGGQIVSFGGASYANSVISQADGRVVLVGEVPSGVGFARLNADGTLDTTFGSGTGKTVLSWSQGSLFQYNNPLAKLDRAGRILVPLTGSLTGQINSGMAVVRVMPNGTPDTSFGPQGVSFQRFASFCSNQAYADALALDSAGRILVAGGCSTATQIYFFLERLHGDDGSLDTIFGTSGASHGAFSGASTFDSAYDVAFDGSGRPVVAGYTNLSNVEKAGVARLTYDLIFTNNLETTPPGRLPGQ